MHRHFRHTIDFAKIKFSWACVYLTTLMFMVVLVLTPIVHSHSELVLPEAAYAHPQPEAEEEATTIYLWRTSRLLYNLYIDNKEILWYEKELAEGSNAWGRLKSEIAGNKNKKILLKIDRDIPWWQVVKVLDCLKQNEIHLAGLLTEGYANIVEWIYYKNQKKKNNDNLRGRQEK